MSSYTKLPYEFDLLYDVKSVEELHSILEGEPHCTDGQDWELCELAEKYNIPLPVGYISPLKPGFPTVVWIDSNGCYQDYPPTKEEEYRFQRMTR